MCYSSANSFSQLDKIYTLGNPFASTNIFLQLKKVPLRPLVAQMSMVTSLILLKERRNNTVALKADDNIR